MSATAGPSASNTLPDGTKLPPGVVLDKDGKPCKTCTSAASWRAMLKQASIPGGITAGAGSGAAAAATTTPSTSTNFPPSTPSTQTDCPPDVEELGRSTWTFLHTLTATYPTSATPEKQTQMRSFLGLFSNLYPCWACAEDFRNWMAEPTGKNEPRLSSRAEFGQWMCDAHNAVNRKLGKKEFDCNFWEERWRTGWKDGRCD